MPCSAIVKSGESSRFYHPFRRVFLFFSAGLPTSLKKVVSLPKIYIMMNGAKAIFPVLISCLFLFCVSSVTAQEVSKAGYKSITEDNARVFVGELAKDFYEGRDAGTEGAGKAAEYIISLLEKWGVEPYSKDGYLQHFRTVKNQNNWATEADIKIDKFIAEGCENRIMKNILACIPGEGEGYVVVGAHYDHLGIDSALVDDICFNGADDNASGVSAVLQLAKAMKKSKVRPKRTVIFAFWDGEEKGLLGSSFFVKRFFDVSKISAYMNFDMVGRGPQEKPLLLSYNYSAKNPLFGEWLKADVEKYKISLEPVYNASEYLIGGSDNTPFARKKVPVVWYTTEGHPDYHRPSDSAEKINYAKLADITRVAYLCLWRLANEESY